MAATLQPPAGRQGPGPMPRALVDALDLRIARLVARRLPGDRRAAGVGAGLELAQLRPYVPGDDVRHLDPAATARTGEPHVRVHVPERSLITWIVLDVSPSMAFGTALRLKADVAEGVALVARPARRPPGRQRGDGGVRRRRAASAAAAQRPAGDGRAAPAARRGGGGRRRPGPRRAGGRAGPGRAAGQPARPRRVIQRLPRRAGLGAPARRARAPPRGAGGRGRPTPASRAARGRPGGARRPGDRQGHRARHRRRPDPERFAELEPSGASGWRSSCGGCGSST